MPLLLAVIAIGGALVIGLLLYLILWDTPQPRPQPLTPPTDRHVRGATELNPDELGIEETLALAANPADVSLAPGEIFRPIVDTGRGTGRATACPSDCCTPAAWAVREPT